MSERSDPNLGMTTQGAIEESRMNASERTTKSGIVSGATGAVPAGMPAPAVSGGYSTTETSSGESDKVLSQVSQKTSQLTEQASEKLGAGKEKAGEALGAGKEKAAGGLESLAGTLRDKGESMGGGQVQSVATMAADKIEAGASLLRGEGGTGTGELMTQVETWIRGKPAESLAIAAGLGFLFSKALR